MATTKRLACFGALLALFIAAIPALAGSTVVSIHSGDTSATFVIRDEPALVMNGFDLSTQNYAFPITIDAVTINVVRPVVGQPVTVVVYEDPNGGTPQDARLLSRADVSITTTGAVRVPLAVPAITSSRIIWAGFYLPVDFRFAADTSGNSVLTYWAWTPFGTFDLANLASAAVFGPGDGSGPVNIAMGGRARISIEFNQSDGRTGTGTVIGGAPLGQQINNGSTIDVTRIMQRYDGCQNILYDGSDILISAQGTFNLACREEGGQMQPGQIGNIGQIPASVPGLERRGVTYQIFGNGDYYATPGNATRMKVPVTHCIQPNAGDLDKAVIGVAYGVPSKWYILPTERYGSYICAELTDTGPVSYFVPRSGSETYLNLDLIWSGFITTNPGSDGIFCNINVNYEWKVKNDGFEASPVTIMRLTNVAVRTGQITFVQDITLPALAPGETRIFQNNFKAPNTFLNEAQRLVFTIDPNNVVAEINEANNVRIIDYVLKPAANGC